MISRRCLSLLPSNANQVAATHNHKEKIENKCYLLWVTNTLFTWPSPLQPGKGQWGSSCLFNFQERGAPLSWISFCFLVARGQPEAVRWDVYLPDMWPWPSHPITGHLEKGTAETLSAGRNWIIRKMCSNWVVVVLSYTEGKWWNMRFNKGLKKTAL